jgi:hypothetical protein
MRDTSLTLVYDDGDLLGAHGAGYYDMPELSTLHWVQFSHTAGQAIDQDSGRINGVVTAYTISVRRAFPFSMMLTSTGEAGASSERAAARHRMSLSGTRFRARTSRPRLTHGRQRTNP